MTSAWIAIRLALVAFLVTAIVRALTLNAGETLKLLAALGVLWMMINEIRDDIRAVRQWWHRKS